MNRKRLILGAGMTGLAAGIASGLPVYESRAVPGGICSSYYMKPGRTERYSRPEPTDACYRFEYGGGHWIFGGDAGVLRFIERYTPVKRYARSSAVFFPEDGTCVPYPLQYHLSHLGADIRQRALDELLHPRNGAVETMADWVRQQFGPTLNALFFEPFHELYTAGLWSEIRPQDNYKTPLDRERIRRGAICDTPDAGYNAEFVYPEEGLDRLALRLAAQCDLRFGKRAVAIDVQNRVVRFRDGATLPYDRIYATVPLNQMVEMTSLPLDMPADPYTSVLVLNIGAHRGPQCPDEHWMYVPQSASGFHRVGFYSNVDPHFLPAGSEPRVSLYVERAFLPEHRPSESDIEAYKRRVVRELQAWGLIGEVDVIDATWIEVAYTWSWPGSTWIEEAIRRLDEYGITMLGRYGRWHFQGIAASIREGLSLAGETHRSRL